MFIPLRTNRPPRRRPRITEGLIVLNLLAYLAGLLGETAGVIDRETLLRAGHLWGRDFHPWQLVTYQFLHDPYAIWHIAFNMLFLWVFGSAVEDRLGRASYLAFYLIGGAVAGVAHMMLEPDAPVIGASGSVAALTGAFLALFPRSRIQVLVIFFIIGVYSIPSLWFIALSFALDFLGTLHVGGEDDVAYAAHLAGYAYGFSLSVALLAIGIVKREEFDVFYLFKQARRRAAFRQANRGSAAGAAGAAGPWASASADTGRRLAAEKARAAARTGAGTGAREVDDAGRTARSEITALIERHELAEAAARYETLLEHDASACLPEPLQLDLANQLHSQQSWSTSARAYELLLDRYPRSTSAEEVTLLLGALYARRLDRPARARELLQRAVEQLREPAQRALAERLLAEIAV